MKAIFTCPDSHCGKEFSCDWFYDGEVECPFCHKTWEIDWDEGDDGIDSGPSILNVEVKK